MIQTIFQLGIGILLHAFLSCYAVKWVCGGLKLPYKTALGFSAVILIIGTVLQIVFGVALGFVVALTDPQNVAQNIEKLHVQILIPVIVYPFIWVIAAFIYGNCLKNENGISIGIGKGFLVFLVISLLALAILAVFLLPVIVGKFITS
ncbi:MAG: hypothetical protein LBJ67_03250 [Planctomycetaceae bacterium]|jgi:hypothetical protein|nr:hypothetical protein [Planctomycetaceae bacterium]